MRIPLGKNVAAGGPAQPSVKIRTAKPPFLFQSTGAYTGNIVIQHSVDTWDEVTDANASWGTLATLTAAASIVIVAAPLYRIRMSGGPSGGAVAGSAYMVEREDDDS